MKDNQLLVGTSKGLVCYERQTSGWFLREIFFRGFPVSMIFIDSRNGDWWVALNHNHWGPKLHKSIDQGNSWMNIPLPKFEGQSSLKKIWVMAEAGSRQPGNYWIGTEPAALFYSDGQNHSLVDSLWNHSSKVKDKMWFGTGRNDPFLHSVLVNPMEESDIIVAISSAGIFRSQNAGESWSPNNEGLVAAYLPNPHSATGHDPHMILHCMNDLNVIWQQNHCGIFLSKDRGQHWTRVSDPDFHPHYGFCLVIDSKRPECAWVIPAQSDEERVAPDLALAVYHTTDFGISWIRMDNGLPPYPTFDIVLRNAFDYRNGELAFGTNNGNLYISENRASSWKLISHNLANILSVKFI